MAALKILVAVVVYPLLLPSLILGIKLLALCQLVAVVVVVYPLLYGW